MASLFLPHQFYSRLKDDIITEEEYENVKKFYQTMKLKDLGEHNNSNSASSFSGCVHRDKSKCCIALPTDAEYVRVFKRTLIRGFSCVNTRLAFDTEILIDDK